MKKDIKYIIKRILIGVGIALAIMFIKQNVYAFEWTTTQDEYIYTSNNVSLSYSYINYYSTRSVSYPFSHTSSLNGSNFSNNILSCSSTTINDVNYCIGSAGNDSGFTSNVYGPYEFLGFDYTFTNTTLDVGNYYVILAGAYDNVNNVNYITDFEYNEDLILESSTYTVNTDDINIKSVLFSSNVDNDLGSTNIYDKIFYFKIYFEVLEEVSNFKFTIGSLATQTGVLSSFNVSTFENYLYRYNFVTNNTYNRYYYKFFYPMIYKHTPGDIYPDYSGLFDDTLSDINDEINQGIVDGTYQVQSVLDDNLGIVNIGNYNIATLITYPIAFLKTFNSDTICSPISINLPINNATISIPCFKDFFVDIFGENLLSVIQTLIIGSIALFLIFDFYDFAMKVLSPDGLITYEDDVVSVNKSTGEVIHHKRRGTR